MDFLVFDAGAQYLLTYGKPPTSYFLLSTTPASGFSKSQTLAAGVGEITGTGYIRGSQTTPPAFGPVILFTQMTWTTGSATNWSNAVASIIWATTTDNSGVAICAWNLQVGGAVRDMSKANTIQQVQPTFNATSS